MNRFLQKARAVVRLLIVLFVGNAGLSLQAQPDTNAPPLSHRWLFIVETSSSMRPRSIAVLSAMQAFLTSGMRGEIKSGDTIGIWTYNQALYTGQLPLQGWSSVTGADVVMRLQSFLNRQIYEKHGNIDPVLPALTSVIKKSEFLTVVLVSDGMGKISGTPFDDSINTAQQGWQKDEQHNKQPIFTVLRVEKGVVTDWTVTPSPWPVDLPPLPPAPKVVEAPAPTPPKPRPPPVIPSFYMSGRKPAASTNSDQPAGTNTPTAPATNAPASTPGNTSTAVPDAAPITSAPTNISQPEAAVPSTPALPAAQPSISNSVPAANSPTIATVSSVAENLVANPATFSTPATQPAETHTATANQPAVPIAPAENPSAAAPHANDSTPPPVAAATDHSSPTATAGSLPAAVATPAAPTSGGSSLWTIGLALAGAGAAVVIFLLIRARPKQQLSSITRSLEQEKRS